MSVKGQILDLLLIFPSAPLMLVLRSLTERVLRIVTSGFKCRGSGVWMGRRNPFLLKESGKDTAFP